MNQENAVVNYSMALKNYNQNGRGWSMRKFCEDEGYVSWNPALPVRLRHDADNREEMRAFYENQMENLRRDQQRLIEEAVSRITKSFEEQISKLIAERDAALLAVKHQRGKRFGGKSERNKGDNNRHNGGENREAEKSVYVDAEDQRQKDMEKADSKGEKMGVWRRLR